MSSRVRTLFSSLTTYRTTWNLAAAAGAWRQQGARPGSIPFLRQNPEPIPPSGHREGRTSQKRQKTRTQKNSEESMVEPPGRKGLKGLQAEEGLHTLEMSFAVDPHGSGVHGSRPAPTCWVRRGCRAGRPREHDSSRPGEGQSPLPFRGLPHPRRTDTASGRRISGSRSGFKARRRKGKSTNE